MVQRISDYFAYKLHGLSSSDAWQYLFFSLCGISIGAVVLLYPGLPGRWGLIVILAIVGLSGLLIIGNLKKILLAAVVIDIPLRWDIYVGARFTDFSLGNREGWLISITSMAIVVLFSLYLIQELVRPGSQLRLLFLENVPLILYLAFSLLSIVVASDKHGSLFQLFFLGQMFLVYLYVANTVDSMNDVLFIVIFLLFGLIGEGLIILAQKFIGLVINFAGIITVNDFGRYAGTLGSPNVAAGFFSLLLALPLAIVMSKDFFWIKWIALAAFLLGSIGLFFTVSRGGWIAYAVSLAIFGIALWARGRIPGWAASILLIIIAAAVALFGGYFITKLFGLRESAALSRLSLMEIAWRMILNNPFLGVGINNYANHIYQYVYTAATSQFLYVVHNKYLLIWAETGLGGLLPFLGFLGLTIWRGWQTWSRDKGFISILALAIMTGIIGQMTHMTVEIFDSRSQVQALWLVAALVTVMERLSRKEQYGPGGN